MSSTREPTSEKAMPSSSSVPVTLRTDMPADARSSKEICRTTRHLRVSVGGGDGGVGDGGGDGGVGGDDGVGGGGDEGGLFGLLRGRLLSRIFLTSCGMSSRFLLPNSARIKLGKRTSTMGVKPRPRRPSGRPGRENLGSSSSAGRATAARADIGNIICASSSRLSGEHAMLIL